MATDVIVPPEQPNASMRCSFCKKTRAQVFKIVLGPNVSICDECVELCNDIIREELEEKAQSARSSLPKPKEILEVLDQYVIGQNRAKRTLAVAVAPLGSVATALWMMAASTRWRRALAKFSTSWPNCR